MRDENRAGRGRSRGAGLVEVVVGVGLLSIVLTGLVAAFHLYLAASVRNVERVAASFLAEEGLEVVRYLRDAGWDANIAPRPLATSLFLSYDGASWEATTTPVLGAFRRTVTFTEAFRKTSDGDIVSASSTDPKAADPDARRVAVAVEGAGVDLEVVSYITDLFGD